MQSALRTSPPRCAGEGQFVSYLQHASICYTVSRRPLLLWVEHAWVQKMRSLQPSAGPLYSGAPSAAESAGLQGRGPAGRELAGCQL